MDDEDYTMSRGDFQKLMAPGNIVKIDCSLFGDNVLVLAESNRGGFNCYDLDSQEFFRYELGFDLNDECRLTSFQVSGEHDKFPYPEKSNKKLVFK